MRAPILALLLAAAAAPAQDPAPFALQARLGLTDSTSDLPPGRAPLTVHVQNDGQARAVDLEVTVRGPPRGDVVWRCRRLVTLSAGQRWRGWFYVPVHAFTREVEVVAWEGAAALARSGSITYDARGDDYGGVHRRHVAVVGERLELRDVAWLAHTDDSWSPPEVELGRRAPADLPDRAEGYGCLDLLVLRDADLSGCSQQQQDALVAWVELGGDVLLVPGRRPELFRDPVVMRLLGGRGATAHRVDRLQGWPSLWDGRQREAFMVFTIDPLPGEDPQGWGSALRAADQDGREDDLEGLPGGTWAPFLGVLSCGAGTTWVVMADPGAPPFDRGAARDDLAIALAAALRGTGPGAAYAPQHPAVDPRLARAFGVRRLPSQGLIVTLVITFILCVGPLSFLLLRRRDRQMLLVVSVPALSLLWTGLILVTGYVTKGLSTEARRATLLTTTFGARALQERTALAFTTAGAGDHAVAFAPGLLPTRVARDERDLATHARDLRLTDAGVELPPLPLGLWAQAAFRAERVRTLPGPLTLARREDGGLELRNGTDLPLARGVYMDPATNGLVLVGPAPAGGVARLGPPAGQVDLVEALAPEPGPLRDVVRGALNTWSDAHVSAGDLLAVVDPPPPAVTVQGRAPDVEVVLLRARGGRP